MKIFSFVLILACLIQCVSGYDDNIIQPSINGSNFGEIPYNISAGLGSSTTILGLSKDMFIKLGILILLTGVVLSIRPFVLGYSFLFFLLIFFVDMTKLLIIPTSIMVLVMFLIAIEIFTKKHYDSG